MHKSSCFVSVLTTNVVVTHRRELCFSFFAGSTPYARTAVRETAGERRPDGERIRTFRRESSDGLKVLSDVVSVKSNPPSWAQKTVDLNTDSSYFRVEQTALVSVVEDDR